MSKPLAEANKRLFITSEDSAEVNKRLFIVSKDPAKANKCLFITSEGSADVNKRLFILSEGSDGAHKRLFGSASRKVSIIGGFANISAEKIGFGKRIFCFAVRFSGKNKSAGAGNGAAADSVQSSKTM